MHGRLHTWQLLVIRSRGEHRTTHLPRHTLRWHTGLQSSISIFSKRNGARRTHLISVGVRREVGRHSRNELRWSGMKIVRILVKATAHGHDMHRSTQEGSVVLASRIRPLRD